MKSFIVLCGGKSTRMGRDKGSMTVNDKPMIIHVIETISRVADEIILVFRDDDQVDDYKNILNKLELPENSKLVICTDLLKDQGPLAGILTGLKFVTSSKAMVIPCDSPFVSEQFVKKMFAYSDDLNYDAYVPKWSDNKLEPLHSIYKKNLYFIIQKLLEENIRDVKSFIMKLNVKFINAESLDKTGRSFYNINQMKDITD
jgi:molybdenum cofactor guanylyltransferase